MTPTQHRAFTAALLARLAADPDVVGLVGLGSTSGLPPGPDEFSDHDLFVVTRPGAQERFRRRLDWLPTLDGPVVLAFPETAHAVKVVFEGGHLAEIAVFDEEELDLARVNRYAVLLDRGEVAARLARVRQATRTAASAAAPGEEWLTGQLLTNLLVGSSRAARGERLSGHQLVRVSALGHLVALLRAGLPPAAAAGLDDLDPLRRLEGALPEVARELDEALRLPVPAAARALLGILERHRPGLASPAARAAVERVIDRAGAVVR